ncbi:hypothetical protein [Microbacterium sp. SLBN-146]|uniref:hypothetical protein n=1 Tax=Microbacterium sp. SLBN-146 TaxID=2768457 RepID=UPI0011734F22|nr:hypothetical protein [Microbacterium sp. SLBN-146]TQJ32391.1 hypothetical protein FBY39_2898 [Microbacterium sp. SLBN-146]
MSSPRFHTPPAPARGRAICMCATGGVCSSFAPGHALHLIQARLASATPSEWTDAVVEVADPESGQLTVRTLDEGIVVELWNASGAATEAEVGYPVALHSRYGVLAIGPRRFNCVVV